MPEKLSGSTPTLQMKKTHSNPCLGISSQGLLLYKLTFGSSLVENPGQPSSLRAQQWLLSIPCPLSVAVCWALGSCEQCFGDTSAASPDHVPMSGRIDAEQGNMRSPTPGSCSRFPKPATPSPQQRECPGSGQPTQQVFCPSCCSCAVGRQRCPI